MAERSLTIHHVAPHFFPEIGGLEQSVGRYTAWLVRRGHRVTVHASALTTRGETLPRNGEMDGVSIRRYPPVVRSGYYRSLFYPDLEAAEVVHLHGYAVRTNDHVARTFEPSRIAFSLHHGVRMPHPTSTTRLLRRAYDVTTGIPTLRRIGRILVAAPGDVSWLTQRGISQEKITVLPTPLADEDFIPGDPSWARTRVGRERFLLYIGRLHEEKGVAYLLEAAAMLPAEAHLVFAGPDDGMQAILERGTRELHLQDRVHFLGVVTAEQKRSLLAACASLVLPSVYEAQGLTVLEAWAQGRPVVASRVGALAEIISDGKDGLLAPYANIPRLSSALNEIWGSESTARALGARGKTIAARFRLEELGETLERIYYGLRRT